MLLRKFFHINIFYFILSDFKFFSLLLSTIREHLLTFSANLGKLFVLMSEAEKQVNFGDQNLPIKKYRTLIFIILYWRLLPA